MSVTQVTGQSVAADFMPGQRVAVTQQIAQRDEAWTLRVEGVIERFEQKKTGSWYAHAKDDKLWLDRLVLRKDDGEIVVCNLDQYTHVDLLQPPPPPPEVPEPSNVAEAAPTSTDQKDES
jgi:hypothetical protein